MDILVIGIKNKRVLSIIEGYIKTIKQYKICIVSEEYSEYVEKRNYDIVFIDKKIECKSTNHNCIVIESDKKLGYHEVTNILKREIYKYNLKESKGLYLKNGIVIEDIKNIMYVESRKNKVHYVIHNVVEDISDYIRLDEVERKIKEYGFIRIHKSYLVNIRYIKKIRWSDVMLKNGKTLPIPKSKYKVVKTKILKLLEVI